MVPAERPLRTEMLMLWSLVSFFSRGRLLSTSCIYPSPDMYSYMGQGNQLETATVGFTAHPRPRWTLQSTKLWSTCSETLRLNVYNEVASKRPSESPGNLRPSKSRISKNSTFGITTFSL